MGQSAKIPQLIAMPLYVDYSIEVMPLSDVSLYGYDNFLSMTFQLKQVLQHIVLAWWQFLPMQGIPHLAKQHST